AVENVGGQGAGAPAVEESADAGGRDARGGGGALAAADRSLRHQHVHREGGAGRRYPSFCYNLPLLAGRRGDDECEDGQLVRKVSAAVGVEQLGGALAQRQEPRALQKVVSCAEGVR